MALRDPKRYDRMLERLKQARRETGLHQREVAARLGVRQTLVSKMELGERRIDPIDLADFAEIYGKPLTWFLDG